MEHVGPGAPNPNLPAVLLDALARRVASLERQLEALQQSSPLTRAAARDGNGTVRLRTGHLAPTVEDGPIGLELFNPDGGSVLRVDEDGLRMRDDNGALIFQVDDTGLAASVKAGGLTVGGAPVVGQQAHPIYGRMENEAITTDHAAVVSNTHTRPAWATGATVFSWCVVQANNGSGSDLTLLGGVKVTVNGFDLTSDVPATSVPDGQVGNTASSYATAITPVETDVVVAGEASVSGVASISTTLAMLSSLVIWTR